MKRRRHVICALTAGRRCSPVPPGPRAQHRDCDRRHRRVITRFAEAYERAVQARAGRAGDCTCYRQLRRQPQIDRSQQGELALSMVDAALDALKGQDKFKGTPQEVRTLMVLYPNRMHVVSIEGAWRREDGGLEEQAVSTDLPVAPPR